LSEAEFIRLWDQTLAPFCVEDLMPARQELALLQPVAAYRRGGERLARHVAFADDHRQRQVAAILAGFMGLPPRDLLDELFERESERGAAARPGGLEPHYAQSVVEEVVLAATRWAREPALREPAGAVLRKVVERTLGGEYWSSAAYALTTLCRYGLGADLVQGFVRFANAPPPDHPLRPSLATEQRFAAALAEGFPPDAVEDRLEQQEVNASEVVFDPELQETVDRWLRLAAELE